MCGINGIVSKKITSEPIIHEMLEQMNCEIYHRGPDQDGFFYDFKNFFSLGMAMRRLSVIDLNSGKQPILSTDNQKVIVFNGEIYNYNALRRDYLSTYNFKTSSDTEVILALYDKFGVLSFAMLDGMFAFSIYDKTVDKVFIARDYFGEKPLYFSSDNDNFYWCSELKSLMKVSNIKPEISKMGLNLYFQLHYIPAPFTIYKTVSKLEANHYLEFDCINFSYEIKDIKQNIPSEINGLSKLEAVHLNHDLVHKSVETRSISDVPLGTFLSGGVDSSIISFCLAHQSDVKIDTFSVGFDKKSFDETDKSRTVSNIIKSNHHEFIFTEKDLIENISKILLNFDEPFADSSSLPTYLVSLKTKEFASVALTGDGGDEVYGGYNKYFMGRLNTSYTNVVPKRFHVFSNSFLNQLFHLKDDDRGFIFKAKRFLKSVNYEGDSYYDIISLGFLESERSEILNEFNFVHDPLHYYKEITGPRNKTLSDFRNIDKLLSLEGDLLVKVDRSSMLNSLECRAPFLNKELWNFTHSLPENYLINGWDKKHLLKESFKKYFPKDFLNKEKQGFGVPIGDWLRGSLKEELLGYTNKKFIEQQNIFCYDIILDLVNNHISGKVDSTIKVFTYYCFQKWYIHNFGFLQGTQL